MPDHKEWDAQLRHILILALVTGGHARLVRKHCWQVRHDRSSSGQERDDRSQRKGKKGFRGHREGQESGAVNNSGWAALSARV